MAKRTGEMPKTAAEMEKSMAEIYKIVMARGSVAGKLIRLGSPSLP